MGQQTASQANGHESRRPNRSESRRPNRSESHQANRSESHANRSESHANRSENHRANRSENHRANKHESHQANGNGSDRPNRCGSHRANGRAYWRANPDANQRGRPIFVEICIRAPLERVWQLTQTAELHPRWDLRFSRITPTDTLEGGGYRFRYERTLGVHTIVGTGTSLGDRERPDGTRTSALRFDTNDPLSPLGDGRGYWRYTPGVDEIGPFVTFTTGYDYIPGWGALGRILDPWLTRPFIGWMTAWSFDRLRIWAETDAAPERWPLTTVLAFWRGGRPRAGRCTRRASDRRIMAEAASTLDRLDEP